MKKLFGGIEAGGTKFVCAIGSGPDDIRKRVRIDTTSPDETIAEVIGFFNQNKSSHPVTSLGIGSFGPLDLDPNSETYGFITSTPKIGWQNINLLGEISSALKIPVKIDTDVAAAGITEFKWGAAKNCNNFIYLTVGTGIGGSIIINGSSLRGLIHPEMGHVYVPRIEGDDFVGACEYHKNCLEGMASGTALNKRWGERAEHLSEDHPAWELEAGYLAIGLVDFILTVSPERIVIGGGVMNNNGLIKLIRNRVKHYLNGYLQSPFLESDINNYIVLPKLQNNSGILGAIAMAMKL